MRSRGTRILALLLGAMVLTAVLLEGGARLLHLVRGEGVALEERRARLFAGAPETDLDLAASGEDRPYYMLEEALQPYVGYVYDHSKSPERTNAHGFLGPDPLIPSAPDELVVALFGGSVAEELYTRSGERLLAELERAFPDRKIRLVALALGGYKQPQQLLALTYFLSLGARFDVVVNLDGFNEIALPYTDNVRYSVYPFFPRFWSLRSASVLEPKRARILSEIQELRERRRSWRARVQMGPIAESAFLLSAFEVIDSSLRMRLAALDRQLRMAVSLARHHSYQSAGPFEPYDDDVALFDDLVGIWKAASRQMARLCSANGMRYVHFLQPNQWVEGSKPLSKEESAWWHRYAETEKYPYAVRQGYPRLVSAGRELRAEGLEFHDLTGIFRSEPRTVFSDECCHFNQFGNDRLADVVAQTTAAALAN